MLNYRQLDLSEAERISEIDATNFIKNVWRKNTDGEYELQEINWTDHELPNGFEWHLNRFREALSNGGASFGCFDGDTLVGYAVTGGKVFGQSERYLLLDQLFISQKYRGQGIGKALFMMCADRARCLSAEKLYLCAGSSENTMAFYKKLGCVPAAEVNEELLADDPNDIQPEYRLGD